MMTGLKAWMAVEEPDDTEPVSFYVAGARGWGDPKLKELRARQRSGLEEDCLCPTPEALQIEDT
jgi:hypothetical protein